MRLFLYTTDQVALLLNVSEATLKQQYLFYDKRHIGAPPKDKMVARNIAAEGSTPQWRIAEKELLRWLRYKGFVITQRGFIS